MVFPQGSLHYQLNDNCRPAKMYAVLNHHDPGTLSLPIRLNLLKENTLMTTYGVNDNELSDILDSAPSGSPAPGSQQCLRKCKLL